MIVENKMNPRFGISAYEPTIDGPPRVKVIKGYLRSPIYSFRSTLEHPEDSHIMRRRAASV